MSEGLPAHRKQLSVKLASPETGTCETASLRYPKHNHSDGYILHHSKPPAGSSCPKRPSTHCDRMSYWHHLPTSGVSLVTLLLKTNDTSTVAIAAARSKAWQCHARCFSQS